MAFLLASSSSQARRPARAAATLAGAKLAAPLLAALLGLLLAAGPAAARPAPDSFADLAEKLLPTVVNVSSSAPSEGEQSTEEMDEFFKEFFDRQRRDAPARRPATLGSGVIIDPTGFIVTNNHVIEGATEVTVRLHDDTELEAKVIGRDEKTDLALLKVEADRPLPAANWGDSETLRIGDWVLAIGNPFGLGGSVTAGIVSARQRDINAGPYDDFLQTDASINRGNSGGPMFDMDGNIVGINTAIFSPSGGSIGIGFAIPSALARTVVEQLREFGRPRRGWLGVRIQTVTPELAEGLGLEQPAGALVANVSPDGPAAKAGIRQGDVVLRFDNRPVDEMRKLPRMVAETPIQKSVPVRVWRQGQSLELQVVLGELPEGEETAALAEPTQEAPLVGEMRIDAFGLMLANINDALRERFSLSPETKGVVVVEVIEGGTAAEKGLQAGDVIVEIDQQQVLTPQDVQRRLDAAKAEQRRVMTLLIYSEGEFQWVALRLDRG